MIRRDILISVGFVVLLLALGCAQSVPVYMESGDEGDDSTLPVEEEEVFEVLEPESPVPEPNDTAPVEDAKQLAVGGATKIKSEEVTLVSDVSCRFTADGPEVFSFRLTNIEDKVWKFRQLSYSERESADNPIVVMNAFQVRQDQLISACGSKSMQPGASALCDFNLEAPEHLLVKKKLRTGVTALGSENENTLSVRTSSHVAEIQFLCEP
ncbi:hypothetical protein ACFL3V_06925 [Nanoarchaeota archaeon]